MIDFTPRSVLLALLLGGSATACSDDASTASSSSGGSGAQSGAGGGGTGGSSGSGGASCEDGGVACASCGDGVCNGNETCDGCADDCGGCAPTSDSGCYRPDIPPVPGCGNTGARDPNARIIIVDTQNDDLDGLTDCSDPTCGGLLANDVCGEGVQCSTGSLREALDADGCRFVVFSGSGYYSFSEVDAYVEDACLTLVGQSAPSPGVTIRDGGIHTVASNVVYQHIRIRPGDGGALLYTSSDHNGILIGYGPGITENVLLDHVSVSWAGGKNVQIIQDIPETAGPYGVVLWRSATTEALWRADNVHADWDGDGPIQPEDWASLPSSFGWHIDVHGDAQVSIMENLAAHNGARNPSWGEGNLYFLSNVVYDFGYDCMPGVPHCNHYPWAALKYGGSAAGSRFEAVGNKFISSPQAAVAGVELLYGIGIWTNEGGDADRAHELDNAVDDSAGPPIQLTVEHEGITGWFEDTDVLDMTGIVTTPSSSVEAFVLSNVGARPLDRDAVDVRVIDQVTQRTGAMIRDPDDDTPGYPPLANDTHVLDIPTDPNGPGACGASRSRIECWALDRARALEPAAN